MKSNFVTKIIKQSLIIIIAIIFFSCKKDNTTMEQLQPKNSETVDVAFKTLKGFTPAIPPYDLDVILRGRDNNVGYVMFRQDPDPAKIITLNTWIRNLIPNHSYKLQRAVDTNLDGNCTGTSWLTLGEGPQPKSIVTDKHGNGNAELWRDVTAIQSGTSFDIHFRVIDAVTLDVVLTSNCYRFTVR